MKNKLSYLYNTLVLIETKGESTLIMADCLKYLGQCINECDMPGNNECGQQEENTEEVEQATE